MADAARVDVAILGGGLAGLTLALQLRQADPGLSVTVLERRSHPAPEAAFKVGESTVEIGAHYFAETLGLREHLDAAQIRKFGFRFFFSDGRRDIDRCTEIGVSQLLPTPSWQIDRGRFENMLGKRAGALGVDFRDGAMVRSVALGEGDGDHRITWTTGSDTHALHARWVVDASGRAAILKRQLGLAEANGHDANAAWWRVDGIIDPNDWSDDPEWRARCTPPDRWRSTNHMCGPGYWFWLIPLASGAHSLGIVCDAGMHPLDGMDTHAKAMDWLRRHQPRVADSLDAAGNALMDFRFLRHFSHGCRQVFGERWALTGEAGLFLDPFYSPGSDFIAIANSYITDLVVRDRAGDAFMQHAKLYEQLYFSFYANTMTLYQDQYPLFGDEQVMPVKVIWDYTFYWALLAPVFFAGRIADIPMYARLRPLFERCSALNAALQPLLREWGERNGPAATAGPGRQLDQYLIDWFRELNRSLCDQLDDAAFDARIAANIERMGELAAEILAQARRSHPGIGDHGLQALLAPSPAGETLLAPAWYGAA
ncbi:FAD-dependent oxidoreductase [Luteimonas sp. MC1782]|uniref:NAD(P)/FAD-dependent oxidoreductase n=1 Tax=Luteimonas sp. MC1782 TaxID=2760305 RepID=UPI0015FF7DA0|nr:FAD-dependent oxidoreductase [Luteimonas sp. MC1782]MBB1473426.1 FAD-dependent oxidoreductase [Luteimonas sp. MC1782]